MTTDQLADLRKQSAVYLSNRTPGDGHNRKTRAGADMGQLRARRRRRRGAQRLRAWVTTLTAEKGSR